MTIHINDYSLQDFADEVGFWAGAKDRWDSYTDEQKECLEEYASECEFDGFVQVNDFVWFEADEILKSCHLMYDEDDEDDEESEELEED